MPVRLPECHTRGLGGVGDARQREQRRQQVALSGFGHGPSR